MSESNKTPVYNPLYVGRKVIYTDAEEITDDNIIPVLQEALNVHLINQTQIDYLWNYYKGNQPVLRRVKEIDDTICNKIVENHAAEIVDFKDGYFLGSPVQYVARTEKASEEDISRLNEYVYSEEKDAKDRELVNWMHVCGVGYRMVLPDTFFKNDDYSDDAPFELYTLDPRLTFVVRSNKIGHKPLMGVTIALKPGLDGAGIKIFDCYTPYAHYKISDPMQMEFKEEYLLGYVPIIEYPLNTERMGAFEKVLPLLDAINDTASDRQDNVDKFVQAYLEFHNMDITLEEFNEFKASGAIKYKDISPDMKASLNYITSELNQSGVQTYVDHMYNMVLVICGMPNRSGSSGGTSDNGIAVELRDGWGAATTRAKSTELMFKKSEKEFLKIVLRMCNAFTKSFSLKIGDIDIRIDRWNHNNILTKSQVLTTMLANNKIHPRLAFQACDMFVDPEMAYQMSMEWFAEHPEEEGEDADEQTYFVSEDDRSTADDSVRS